MKWLCSIVFVFILQIATAQCIDGDCWNGKGVHIYPSGAKYVGEFVNGKINGKGILYFSNGDEYNGNWVDHYRTGNGKMTFKKGGQYIGEFKKNKFNGQGKYTYPNGDLYYGEWVESIAEGQGEYLFVNGNVYVGNFKAGKFDGFGTMLYEDGSYFEGQWKRNKKEGAGIMYSAAGNTTEGVWEDGKIRKNHSVVESKNESPKDSKISSTKEIKKEEAKQKVEAKESSNVNLKTGLRNCNSGDCISGKGQFDYRDGTKYIGDFQRGKPHGEGTVFYSNGDKYVGGWKNHAPNGKGIMHYRYGRNLGAMWKDGKVQEILQSIQDIPDEVVDVDYSPEVKIWSVIVGVGRYNHMPSLKYTDDDAYRLFAFLKSPEGGAVADNNIRVLIDEGAERENILRTMKRIFLQADENDVVMFYFSGHGFDGSFLPSDYDGFNNLLKHKEVIDILNQSKAKHKLVFADACHSGSLNKEKNMASRSPYQKPLKDFYTTFENSSGGLALLLSSKKDEFSLEDQGLRQGVFSHYLMRGLKGEANVNGDGIIDITELFNYVNKRVINYTNGVQTPNLSGKFDPKMPVSWK